MGKAVKMIAALLKHLPPSYAYRVVFMQRNMDEILASQKQMLVRRGQPTDAVSDERMASLFARHVQKTQSWLAKQPNFDVLYVSYNDILAHPIDWAQQINQSNEIWFTSKADAEAHGYVPCKVCKP